MKTKGTLVDFAEKLGLYIVSLDKGFWGEHNHTFISHLVVHPDNIEFLD
jgi:hypothetical protein